MRLYVRTCAAQGCPSEVTWPVGRTGKPPRYCSPACKSREGSRQALARIYYDHELHEEWKAVQAAIGRARTAKKVAERRCPHCGGPMPPRHRKACDKPDCQRTAINARMRVYQRNKTAEYRARGESYKGQWRSPEQRAALDALPKDLDKKRQRKQEGWQRRRAQKRTAPYESFRHVEIYERDGWLCGLCGKPVDPALRHLDHQSATLDHIIPLSPPHNGPHIRANVQLAHRECNIRKRNRLDWKPEVADDPPHSSPQPR
jgi:5-methylcytosine-specific restriction endonuclease McrA